MTNSYDPELESTSDENSDAVLLPTSRIPHHEWKNPFSFSVEETVQCAFNPQRPKQIKNGATSSDSKLLMVKGDNSVADVIDELKEVIIPASAQAILSKGTCPQVPSKRSGKSIILPYQTKLTPELERNFKKLLTFKEYKGHLLSLYRIPLEAQKPNKKTLVVDLDGTLICNTFEARANLSEDFPKPEVVTVYQVNADKSKSLIKFYVRPYAFSFLRMLSEHYEIVVFTASILSYARAIVDYLDPEKVYIRYILHRAHCVMRNELVVKDLKILGQRELRNLVMIDNSVISFASNLKNGIYIPSYYGNASDKELLRLIGFLVDIVDADDVRPLIKGFANIEKLFEEYKAKTPCVYFPCTLRCYPVSYTHLTLPTSDLV
eukprot:TRINITY_DN2586_c0_g1_i14.p1 TRINITY_DN2586_c0_g1~~TRINITY_DN2586_c0_g1_i14.p1  ORF type:complete len:377 (+),score=30.06 TRINITY_DN2586_c0_g1_i14:237-1367(+)